MTYRSVLVTGANKGIGLEFVRQFCALPEPPKHLFATYRSESTIKELESIRNSSKACQVHLIKMDVTSPDDVSSCAKAVEDQVGEEGLTLLVNNAGALRYGGFPDVTDGEILFHVETNALGPYKVLKAVYPMLRKASDRAGTEKLSFTRSGVLNISSTAGSVFHAGTTYPGIPPVMGYSISKAALNMTMKVVSTTAKREGHGVLVVQMCPGWVKTDMGTQAAEMTPKESVSTMLQTIGRLDESHQGAFLDRHGTAIPF